MNNSSYAENCPQLLEDQANKKEEIKKLAVLREKNLKAYEDYKDDFSKKTKIFSNIMIINNKLETLKLQDEEYNDKLTKSGCLK